MTIHRSILRIRPSLGHLVVLALLAGPLGAQGTPPREDPVPAHDTFTVASRALGEARAVNVHTPAGYDASSAARFPVLYMPDGGLDEDFPHVVHTVDSLAGLFVLETFLTEPVLFDHYVALDPSVWWNGDALVDSAQARLAALDSAPRTLYLSTSNVPEIATGTARLAALLRTVAPRGLAWVYAPRPDLTHATIFRAVGPAALARALR